MCYYIFTVLTNHSISQGEERMAKQKKPKAKRPGPAAARRDGHIVQIEVSLAGLSAYIQPTPRRHRGPSTAGAVPGTGRPKKPRH